jgi:hypothetical protein
MKLVIDEKVCIKHKMTLSECLLALAFRNANEKDIHNMLGREILVRQSGQYLVTQHWSDVLDEIICDSSGSNTRSDEELIELAIKVKDCFPQCKMRDRFGRETPYYYRCNKSEVAKSLKRFFTQFGNEYSDEDIIDATKRYVASFNGNYTGMRLAKYFIMKNPTKQDENGRGYVEQVSDLLTFLENKESEGEGVVVNNTDDWLINSRN